MDVEFSRPDNVSSTSKFGQSTFKLQDQNTFGYAIWNNYWQWLHALIAQVTSDAESLSSLGSEEDLQSIGAKSPYSDQEINRTVNEHANSLIHVLSELSMLKAKTEQLNDEVSDLKQRLQDDSSDESYSENED